MTGTDVATYMRERPGMSAFVLEDGVVYHTYSTYARGLDGLWGMYQWLDRAPRAATRRASGGAATTSTTRASSWLQRAFPASLLRRLGAALRRQRGGDDRLVRVHVGDGRDADARRLDDVDGVDADARPDVARRRGVVPRHVGRDDGGDDAAVAGPDAVALPRRPSAGPSEARLGRLTALVGAGYFFVWTVLGVAAFPLGVALAAVEMQQPALARAVPIAVGVVVLVAGALQLTAWKARHLACCREAPGRGRALPADAGTAWRHGLRLGAPLQPLLRRPDGDPPRRRGHGPARDGRGDGAITVERLAPAGERVARAIGVVASGRGCC